MLKPLICGTGGFQREDDELSSCSLSPKSSPVSTPRKSKRSNLRKSHNRDSKNPYSSRGLDKFSAVLAELEEKKQKIYSQIWVLKNPAGFSVENPSWILENPDHVLLLLLHHHHCRHQENHYHDGHRHLQLHELLACLIPWILLELEGQIGAIET
ncbi:hypothetical protein SLA2020_013100 [Shorea laevis]